MKILIIQLTRPGDIFCSWPVISAIKRQNPGAEIHFLIRKKFAGAARDFSAVDHFWHFDSERWLSPIIDDPMNTGAAQIELGKFADAMRSEKFDQIINLSFSPSSSFLTHLVTSENSEVRGYTRSSDFYLHIPDEASRYFRAQVGVNKFNRLHIIDIFAMIAGVNLSDLDLVLYPNRILSDTVVCHLGASVENKAWPVDHWLSLIKSLLDSGYFVQMVGGGSDSPKAQAIAKELGCENLQDLIGQTEFSDLAKILSKAKLLVGADSGPMHVANGAGCPTLCLSLGPVKYWETGPTVKGSQVLACGVPHHLKPEEVFLSIQSIVHMETPNKNARLCDGKKPVRYDDQGNDESAGWDTVTWLYFGADRPSVNSVNKKFIDQILEVCEIAAVQINLYKSDFSKTSGLQLIEKIDDVLKVIGQTDKSINPILEYFFCEKENILPGTQAEVIEHTLNCYQWLKSKTGELKGEPRNDSEFLGNTGSAQKVSGVL